MAAPGHAIKYGDVSVLFLERKADAMAKLGLRDKADFTHLLSRLGMSSWPRKALMKLEEEKRRLQAAIRDPANAAHADLLRETLAGQQQSINSYFVDPKNPSNVPRLPTSMAPNQATAAAAASVPSVASLAVPPLPRHPPPPASQPSTSSSTPKPPASLPPPSAGSSITCPVCGILVPVAGMASHITGQSHINQLKWILAGRIQMHPNTTSADIGEAIEELKIMGITDLAIEQGDVLIPPDSTLDSRQSGGPSNGHRRRQSEPDDAPASKRRKTHDNVPFKPSPPGPAPSTAIEPPMSLEVFQQKAAEAAKEAGAVGHGFLLHKSKKLWQCFVCSTSSTTVGEIHSHWKLTSSTPHASNWKLFRDKPEVVKAFQDRIILFEDSDWKCVRCEMTFSGLIPVCDHVLGKKHRATSKSLSTPAPLPTSSNESSSSNGDSSRNTATSAPPSASTAAPSSLQDSQGEWPMDIDDVPTPTHIITTAPVPAVSSPPPAAKSVPTPSVSSPPSAVPSDAGPPLASATAQPGSLGYLSEPPLSIAPPNQRVNAVPVDTAMWIKLWSLLPALSTVPTDKLRAFEDLRGIILGRSHLLKPETLRTLFTLMQMFNSADRVVQILLEAFPFLHRNTTAPDSPPGAPSTARASPGATKVPATVGSLSAGLSVPPLATTASPVAVTPPPPVIPTQTLSAPVPQLPAQPSPVSVRLPAGPSLARQLPPSQSAASVATPPPQNDTQTRQPGADSASSRPLPSPAPSSPPPATATAPIDFNLPRASISGDVRPNSGSNATRPVPAVESSIVAENSLPRPSQPPPSTISTNTPRNVFGVQPIFPERQTALDTVNASTQRQENNALKNRGLFGVNFELPSLYSGMVAVQRAQGTVTSILPMPTPANFSNPLDAPTQEFHDKFLVPDFNNLARLAEVSMKVSCLLGEIFQSQFTAVGGPKLTEIKYTGPFSNGTIAKGAIECQLVLILDKPLTQEMLVYLTKQLRVQFNGYAGVQTRPTNRAIYVTLPPAKVDEEKAIVEIGYTWPDALITPLEETGLVKQGKHGILQVRQWLWFQNATASSIPFARTLLRLLTWVFDNYSPNCNLSPWVIEMLMFNAVMRMDSNRRTSLVQLVRGVFEFIASGCLLPGGLSLSDPTVSNLPQLTPPSDLASSNPLASSGAGAARPPTAPGSNTPQNPNSTSLLFLHSVNITKLVWHAKRVVLKLSQNPMLIFRDPTDLAQVPIQPPTPPVVMTLLSSPSPAAPASRLSSTTSPATPLPEATPPAPATRATPSTPSAPTPSNVHSTPSTVPRTPSAVHPIPSAAQTPATTTEPKAPAPAINAALSTTKSPTAKGPSPATEMDVDEDPMQVDTPSVPANSKPKAPAPAPAKAPAPATSASPPPASTKLPPLGPTAAKPATSAAAPANRPAAATPKGQQVWPKDWNTLITFLPEASTLSAAHQTILAELHSTAKKEIQYLTQALLDELHNKLKTITSLDKAQQALVAAFPFLKNPNLKKSSQAPTPAATDPLSKTAENSSTNLPLVKSTGGVPPPSSTTAKATPPLAKSTGTAPPPSSTAAKPPAQDTPPITLAGAKPMTAASDGANKSKGAVPPPASTTNNASGAPPKTTTAKAHGATTPPALSATSSTPSSSTTAPSSGSSLRTSGSRQPPPAPTGAYHNYSNYIPTKFPTSSGRSSADTGVDAPDRPTTRPAHEPTSSRPTYEHSGSGTSTGAMRSYTREDRERDSATTNTARPQNRSSGWDQPLPTQPTVPAPTSSLAPSPYVSTPTQPANSYVLLAEQKYSHPRTQQQVGEELARIVDGVPPLSTLDLSVITELLEGKVSSLTEADRQARMKSITLVGTDLNPRIQVAFRVTDFYWVKVSHTTT